MSMWSERLGPVLAPFLDEVVMTMVLSEPEGVWALGAGLHRDTDLVLLRLLRLTGMSISL